jgi:YHS domain-containing protein
MVTDPVSGQDFGLSADAPNSTYKGTLYYFENADNKGKFEKEPAKYAKVLLP